MVMVWIFLSRFGFNKEAVVLFRQIILGCTFLSLAGCVTEPEVPQTPQFQAAMDVALLEQAQDRCSAYLGGFSDARDLQTATQKARQRADAIGTTPTDLVNARQVREKWWVAGEILGGTASGCSQILGAAGAVAAQL